MTRPGDRPAGNRHQTRSAVLATHGLIATSQPLASAAGLKVLQDGGTAVDAAVTAAAVLAVVEPSMTGIGGDLFAIVYEAKTNALHGLNASGRSPYAATLGEFTTRNLAQVPNSGELSATVPGVVDGWSELLSKHGTLSLANAIAPAIDYATQGFAVSEIVGAQWLASAPKLAADPRAAETFLPGGQPPKTGGVFANPRLAATLRIVADGGREAFYNGPIARAIAADMRARNGLLAERDFADHASDWIQPITTNYRGYDVYELPPNTQGFLVLEMLNILEGFDLAAMGHNSADYLHALVEAKRIAFADRAAYLGDPDGVPADLLRTLISKEYAAARRKEIDPARTRVVRAAVHSFAGLDRGDTIYLTAADGNGNAISLIQSLFSDFGCGIVAGDTGIVLSNRGSSFNLTPGHPAAIGPRKRPPHTLIPAFVMKDGAPFLSFGVMGGDHQAQGHTQVLINLIDFGMNVQEAGEAARVTHGPNGLQVESAVPQDVRDAVARRGHTVFEGVGGFGGYQGIRIDRAAGVLMGGSDVRKDGLAIGY
jgi:gamma-glutamyltranspeptidase / glutathione hydrolase